MANRYRTLWTIDNVPTIPLHDQARGGRPAKSYPVRNIMNAEDTLAGYSRRILLREGMRGMNDFSMPNGDPIGGGLYPDSTTYREISQVTAAKLSPGHFLAWQVLACPTGPTELAGEDTGTFGTARLTVTWSRQGMPDVITEHELTFTPSGKANGGIATGFQTQFNQIERRFDTQLYPDEDILNDIVVATEWSQGVEVDLLLEYSGGVRIVDVCVYERPIVFAADTTAQEFPILCHSVNGGPKAILENPFPVESIDTLAVDPTQGGIQALETAKLMVNYGPSVMSLGAYKEGTTTVFDPTPGAFSTTSTSFVEIRGGWNLDGAADANRPGVSGSSGSTCLNIALAGLLEMGARSGAGVIPVKVRILAEGVGVLRVRSEDYTMVELNIASGGFIWYESIGTLKCGIVGDDPSTFETVVRASVGTVSVRYMSIEYEVIPT